LRPPTPVSMTRPIATSEARPTLSISVMMNGGTGSSGITASRTIATSPGSVMFRPFMSFILMRIGGQRAPDQHRNEQRENDDLLEVAGEERGERLDEPDADRRHRRDREAGKAADDRCDETLEADEEAGVVVDRRDRRDQDS